MEVCDKTMTYREWLEDLAGRDTSTESDASQLQGILRKVGYSQAIVTCGVVYLEGHGTMEYPPASIHQIVKVLLKV